MVVQAGTLGRLRSSGSLGGHRGLSGIGGSAECLPNNRLRNNLLHGHSQISFVNQYAIRSREFEEIATGQLFVRDFQLEKIGNDRKIVASDFGISWPDTQSDLQSGLPSCLKFLGHITEK